MPKQKRHQAGKYPREDKSGFTPDFADHKPYTLFRSDNGLWGVKNGDGAIEIEPAYYRAEQTDWEREHEAVRLVSKNDVLIVTPDGWDIQAWISEDLTNKF